MKLFCSIAITGENETEIVQRMQMATDALKMVGHEAYCQSLDPQANKLRTQSVATVMRYAFEKLTQCDGLVAIVTSDRKSEGMLMEIGAALATSKPVYLFWHVSANTNASHLPKIATKIFHWQTNNDLQAALKQL